MKKPEKSSNKPSGKYDVRKDRQSATGINGSPKKGGHGGKFTWAGNGNFPVEIGTGTEAMDAKDPNFEDPEEAVAN